jgi:hypothetical protein
MKGVAIAVAFVVLASPSPAGAVPPCAATPAGRVFPLSEEDLAALDRGEPVVRDLPASADHEVVIGGAVRVDAPAGRLLELLRDVPRWKHGPAILQLGWFGASPAAADVASLRLDPPDLDALRRCAGRPCDTKLASLAPEAFRAFDWRAPGAKARAEELVREGLVRYVTAYLARGDAALFVYASRRVSLATELAELRRTPPFVQALPPALATYFDGSPREPPAGASSRVYWARETFGMKPMLSVYHVVVHRPPGEPHAYIATRQIFASRYIDASLELTSIGDDVRQPGTGCCVTYLAGSRTDSLRGFWGGMKRGPTVRAARDGVAELLRRLARLARGGDTR